MTITTESDGSQVKRYNGKTVLHKVPDSHDGNIVIPQSVTHIQVTSFSGSKGIKTITIQDNVKDIKLDAFKHCTELEKIIVSRDNKYFESDSKGVLFTKGMEWLIFVPKKFSGIYVVPAGVKHIAQEAFKGCKNITTLMLAQTVASIGTGAFQDCTGLVHMTIPKSVRQIQKGAFSGCTNLCGITVSAENEDFKSDSFGVLYSKDGTQLLWVPLTLSGRYCIPNGVRIVESMIFCGCKNLEMITFPQSVKDIWIDAFRGCDSLRAYIVAPSNTNYSSDDYGVLLNKDQTEIILAPADLSGCYIMPDHVNHISLFAFQECRKLTEVYISLPQKRFTWSIFGNCPNLKVIRFRDYRGLLYDETAKRIVQVQKNIEIAAILNGVEEIEEETFANCENLKQIYIPKMLKKIGDYAFWGCSSLEKFIVHAENNIFFTDVYGVLYQRVKSNIVLLRAPVVLTKGYRVPDGVTHIARGAFEGCENLIGLILPRTIRQIQDNAFSGCTGLKKVALTYMPYFYGDKKLFKDSPNLCLYGGRGSDVEAYAKCAGIPFAEQDVSALLAKYKRVIN